LVRTDASLLEAVRRAIGSIGHLDLLVTPGIDEARDEMAREDVVPVLAHQECVGELDQVAHLHRAIVGAKRSLPMLVLSDRHRPEQALALLRAGVADYLCRPLDLSRLSYLIDMLTVRARVARTSVASQDTTVLLGGETGTGKTRLGRLIHESSPRRGLPFLAISCGALSTTLIESELFGHVKGAFTGADRDHSGRFAEVGRGTLLLDEVDALPLPLQAKLLRAVEERLFEPVGSNRSLPMQGRLIAASNRPLDQEAAAGRFRPDQYHRPNVISFTIPPLRDRRDTIPHLAGRFIVEFAGRGGRAELGIGRMTLYTKIIK
jgi:DNA-binding NtrC family response regulator